MIKRIPRRNRQSSAENFLGQRPDLTLRFRTHLPIARLFASLGLGVLMAAALPGCSAPNSSASIALEAPGAWAQEVSLDIENDLGEVVVETDAKLWAPTVTIRRFGEIGGGPIQTPDVIVSRQGGESGQTLRIVAPPVSYPPAASFLPPIRRALSITVRTPPVFGVLVKNSGGAVRLSGVGGPIQVNNGIAGGTSASGTPQFPDRAKVVLDTDRPLREPIDLTSGPGGIDLSLPADSDLAISVAGAKGRVSVHAPAGALMEVRNDPGAWSAKLGDAASPALAKASGGPVNVEITGVKNRRPPR